jgi:hypothetical protein
MALLPGFHASQTTEVRGVVGAFKSQRRAGRNFSPAEIAGQWDTNVVIGTGADRRSGMGFGLHDSPPQLIESAIKQIEMIAMP